MVIDWFSHNWIAVTGAGVLGGLISTFLPSGTDVQWPSVVASLFRLEDPQTTTEAPSPFSSFFQLIAHVIRNSAAGAVVAFIVWATQNPDETFATMDVAPYVVGVSLIIGLGGAAALNKLAVSSSLAQDRLAWLEIARSVKEEEE